MDKDMSNENIKVSKIKYRLHVLQQDQFKSSQEINELDDTEHNFIEIDKQDKRMIDSLYHTWKADNELIHMINDSRAEMQHCRRRIISEIEQKREKLIEEKKRLYNQEEDLYTLKRILIQEEKK